ncbi:MAG: hypothetical protein WA793_14145, partial [Sphingorhabdus sp.]|uniref:hypothetical protein n=1 Tax=Sphingorhabdus sp. TaxID=1902408 RepID=UPI003CBE7B49
MNPALESLTLGEDACKAPPLCDSLVFCASAKKTIGVAIFAIRISLQLNENRQNSGKKINSLHFCAAQLS